MVAGGLVEEARALHPRRRLTALLTVGYQELFSHFEGEISREEAIALIQRNSRRYAKRQLTWYRRDGHWKLLRPTDWELALQYIEESRRKGLRMLCRKAKATPALPAGSGNLEIQLLDVEGERGLLFYSEKVREALLQGPFLRETSDAWAGTLLVHQGALLSDERQAFAFSTLEEEYLQKAGLPEESRPESLPNWMASHWKAFEGKHPEGKIWHLIVIKK